MVQCSDCLPTHFTRQEAAERAVYLIPGEFCIRDCKPHQALTPKNECIECSAAIPHCKLCSGGPKYTCRECDPGFLTKEKMKAEKGVEIDPEIQCVRDCGAGRAVDFDNNCVSCGEVVEGCGSCLGGRDVKCQTCADLFELNSEARKRQIFLDLGKHFCVRKCPPGQAVSTLNKCFPCGVGAEGCGRCRGGQNFLCKACVEYYTINPEARKLGIKMPESIRCVKNCQAGHAVDTKNNCFPCVEKVEGCAGCLGGETFQCVSCRSGTHMLHSEAKKELVVVDEKHICVKKCPEGQGVTFDNNCVKCDSRIEGCATCRGGRKFHCLSCKSGFISAQEALKQRIVVDKEKISCVKICPKGAGIEPESNKCVPCTSKLASCEACIGGKYFVCTKCQKGYIDLKEARKRQIYLPAGFQCFKECPAGTHALSVSNNCFKCDSRINHCQSCSGGPDSSCEQCKAGYSSKAAYLASNPGSVVPFGE